MKKNWILEKKEDDNWKYFFGSNNYYAFCGTTIKKLREVDKEETSKLKESLGNVVYSDEIKAQFKKVHDKVRDSFRIIITELPDEEKISESSKYEVKEIKDGVYKYLWSVKSNPAKK